MKHTFQTLWVVIFASVLTANADLLIASFDLGDGQVYNGFGPYAGASAQFTAVTSASGATATDNGITLLTYDATKFFIGLDSADPDNPNALFGDYAVQEGPGYAGGDNQGNFKLTGLDPDQEYNIYIIAPNGTDHGADNVYGGDYVVTTGTADTNTVTATGGVSGPFSGWIEGRDYAVFSNAIADEFGEFSGTFNRIDGQAHTGIAGIQLVAIPEPATMTIILLGTGLLIALRRRFCN